jgi:serine/threonine protein kinase
MAPEIINDTNYIPEKIDIFSLGPTIYSLMFGHRPFETASIYD